MRYLLLTTLIISLSLVAYGQSSITIYYNGTVVAHVYNESVFKIIGSNVTNLKVIGTKFNLSGDYLLFYNGTKVTVIYDASFGKGVIQGSEPYNATYHVLVPATYTFAYISPPPVSLETSGSLYNLTLEGGSLDVVYSTPPQSSGSFGREDLIILAIVIVTDSVLGYFLYNYVRSRRSMKEKETSLQSTPKPEEEEEDKESAELTTQELNERDIMVLESFKKGAKTLSDAVRDTGLPKSTVYRRIRKLVKLGYLIERREGGKIWYELPSQQDNPKE